MKNFSYGITNTYLLSTRCGRYVKAERVIKSSANMIYASFTNLSVGYINL
jgi:hypothetical protein